MHIGRLAEQRDLVAQIDQCADRGEEFGVCVDPGPVDPADLVVLRISIVVAAL